MATSEINVAPSVADQQFKTVLENETFTLRCRWNETAGQWMLDVSDEQGLIVPSVPMVINVPLLAQYASKRLPKGALMMVDTSGKLEEAGLADLGARVKLLYIDSTDF